MFQANSPKLLYAVGDYKETRRLLTQIGRKNGALRRRQRYKKLFKAEVEEEMGEEEREYQVSLKSFFSSSVNTKNLIAFVLMYSACSYCYYLINLYVKYLSGDIFSNQITHSLSEAISCLFPLLMLRYISVKRAFAVSFLISIVSCAVILLAEVSKHEGLIPIGLFGAKAGINIAFCFLYIGSISFFENQFLGL